MKEHKKSLNLLVLGPYPLNTNIIRGGIEASIYGLTKTLSKNENISLTVISPNGGKDMYKREDNINIFYIANPYKYSILYGFRVKKVITLIKNIKPDICHLHGSSLLVLLTILYLYFKKMPFVVTIHGIVSIERKNDFLLHKTFKNFIKWIIHTFVEHIIILFSKYIIVDTEYVKTKLPMLSRKEVFVIPQGIDNDFFRIKDEPIFGNIISIGVISERKGYEYAIKAISEVKKQFPQVKYHIIGALSNSAQKRYYEKLMELIDLLDLKDSVYLHINNPKNILINYLKKAYIFILHSQEESQGIVFCEAMAAGKPIVATNVGGVPYIIKDGITGFLSDYGDTKTFTKNIIKLLENSKLREKMSKNSRFYAEKYRWSIIEKDIMKVYRYAIEKHKKS